MLMSKLNLALLAALAIGTTAALAQKPTPLLTHSPDELVAVLKSSDSSQKDKVDACRQLSVIGTPQAVQALAALLPDEQLNHMARFALEPLPDPSVDNALRAALGTLQGRQLVGVIGSIGVRRDAQAVGELARLLNNPNDDVAQAAARALGSIGNAAAVKVLRAALPNASAANQLAVCEGLLRCAETLSADGRSRRAVAIYDLLRESEVPQQVRGGAVRGAILARGETGISVLRESLRSKDYSTFAAAAQTALELPAAAVTKALAAELSQVPQDNQILLLQVLGKRADEAALPAVSAAAKQGQKAVRIAAIQSMAQVGSPAAAPALIELIATQDQEIAQAAQESLASLRGSKVDSAVMALLDSGEPSRKLAGVELAARRRMTAAVPHLLRTANDADPKVRSAALVRVGELGGPGEVPAVLDLLPKLSTAQDLDAAETALSALCSKSDRPEACAQQLTARLPQTQPAQKSALLRVLSSVGGPAALAAVRSSVNDPSPEVHATAIRALGSWRTADAAPHLLELAKTAQNPTDRTLSLRGYLGLAANTDFPADQRLAMARQASEIARQAEEKRLLLAALGSINSPESVALIAPYLEDQETKEEAAAAIVAISERLMKGKQADQAAAQLIAPLEKTTSATSNEEMAKRARNLLQQAQKRAGNR
jgi:HEAT repeat protein